MSSNTSYLWSTVGKKILMAVTGLILIMFLVGHLAGNLQLLMGNSVPFNKYADLLTGMGVLLIVVELFLVAFFLVHAVSAVSVTLNNWQSRPKKYDRYVSAGEPSRKTLSSATMIWTGLILLVFTVLHLYQFKYGPGVAEGYVTEIDGKQVRDLYRLVIEVYQDPVQVLWYVAAMGLLAFHLRHGFWSAFQSLGVHHPRWTPVIYTVGVLVAILLGVGFLGIPVWIYLRGGS
jgi:succinate dehydrogenase / fumarate reductase cytochrome b subunit